MNAELLNVVLVAAVLLGMAVCAALFHWRLNRVLHQLVVEPQQELEELLARLQARGELQPSLAQLELEDAARRGTQEAHQVSLGDAALPTTKAANDPFYSRQRAAGGPENGVASAYGAPARAAREKRPCQFCARVRALLSRKAPRRPLGGS